MPFIPHGKKAKRRSQRSESDEEDLDWIVTRAQHAVYRRPHRCLQISVLVEHVLKPAPARLRFALRLGALHVAPRTPGIEPIHFDPRGPNGEPPAGGRIPRGSGFHAWLEDSRGDLLDPSVYLTLAGEGYDVEDDDYIIGSGRSFNTGSLLLHYEVLPQLRVTGLAESANALAQAIMPSGEPNPVAYARNVLDVTWDAA